MTSILVNSHYEDNFARDHSAALVIDAYFKGHELLEFAGYAVVPYLEDEDGAT